MELLFWISISIVLYTFLGYGVVITALAALKKKKAAYPILEDEDLPEVSLLIAAYNEEEILLDKIRNSLESDYPKEKLIITFITDGTSDGSFKLLSKYPEVRTNHSSARKGKIAAINRVMPEVYSPITIFTDANVMLNPAAIRNLVHHFQSNLVAAVSGEKVVQSAKSDAASASGEGFYWKYESYLKKKDAEWNTLVGSAGELVAIRTNLYQAPAEDTIIEDFVMTIRLAAQGYRVAYEPRAIAAETGSANVEEEEKRKVRISAGGIQAIRRLPEAMNFLKHPRMTFQYFSHRVLRWTLMPIALVFVLISSASFVADGGIYTIAFVVQIMFYGLALIGYFRRNQATSQKYFHIPFYFTFMHICVVKGWIRYWKGKQSATWEKALRATAGLQTSEV
jgi:biofilm PGA synthesis N-glycosyltransferase PgaC